MHETESGWIRAPESPSFEKDHPHHHHTHSYSTAESAFHTLPRQPPYYGNSQSLNHPSSADASLGSAAAARLPLYGRPRASSWASQGSGHFSRYIRGVSSSRSIESFSFSSSSHRQYQEQEQYHLPPQHPTVAHYYPGHPPHMIRSWQAADFLRVVIIRIVWMLAHYPTSCLEHWMGV
eukprot:scaffold33_cov48-Attheya_sp.AAC.1